MLLFVAYCFSCSLVVAVVGCFSSTVVCWSLVDVCSLSFVIWSFLFFVYRFLFLFVVVCGILFSVGFVGCCFVG